MRKWIPVVLFLALVLSACGEDGRYGFTFINQGEHVIESGQIMTSDTAIAGGNVTFEQGSTLRGSIYLFGGTLTVDSLVEGDVAALGGAVTLGDNAEISGDFYVAGSDVSRSPQAIIGGEDTELTVADLGMSPADRPVTVLTFLLQFTLSVITGALLVGLAVRLMPSLSHRLAKASTDYPLMSGALGLLILLVVPMFLVFMIFTIVLIPGTIVGVILLGVLALYGFVGLGRGIGERITGWRGWNFSPSITGAFGGGVIAAVISFLTLIPFAGEIALGLLGAIALGSVVLTGFGTRTYEPPQYEPDTELA